jgi:hypothetical protein
MSSRLAGLDSQEKAACLLAERVLGAQAQAWDVDGRQGAVDAMLTLSDGRQAAFEITAHGPEGVFGTDSVLGKTDNHWPAPGEWWWTIQVGSFRDIPGLLERYVRIAQLCESHGVARPEDLRWRGPKPVDPDIVWLVDESSSNMFGHPDVPVRDGDLVRDAMVNHLGRGGGVSRDFTGLPEALVELFADRNIAKHVAKLGRASADEHHLFLAVHFQALPFNVADALMLGDATPAGTPVLPGGVTHLWLAPQFGPQVLLGTSSGWTSHAINP